MRFWCKDFYETAEKIYQLLNISHLELFSQYAEPIPNGETCKAIAECAKNLNIFVVAGTIPEIDDKKLYNTCAVFNPKGELIAKHRKVFLKELLNIYCYR